MDIGDYYWGLYRGHYRGPFPHSLLSTRPKITVRSQQQDDDGYNNTNGQTDSNESRAPTSTGTDGDSNVKFGISSSGSQYSIDIHRNENEDNEQQAILKQQPGATLSGHQYADTERYKTGIYDFVQPPHSTGLGPDTGRHSTDG